MPCTTCADEFFIVGVPYQNDSDIVGDDTDVHEWLVPCPECSPHMSLEDVFMKAAVRFPVGWALTSFTLTTTGECRWQPWPFKLRLDERDEFAPYTLGVPDLDQTMLLYQRTMDPDPDPNGLIE